MHSCQKAKRGAQYEGEDIKEDQNVGERCFSSVTYIPSLDQLFVSSLLGFSCLVNYVRKKKSKQD